MSKRGVRQLKELVIRYSDLDGSSKGIREWIRNDLITLANNNNELEIRTELKRAVHPFLRGMYLNGNSKTICVKNKTPEEVHNFALDLRNQHGMKVIKIYLYVLFY
jgi:large subunit ribosomal protein L43